MVDPIRLRIRSAIAAALVALLLIAGGGAEAATTGVVSRGRCSGPTRWRLALVADADVLRVRLAARSGRPGQRWNIFMDHDRVGFFAGHRISGEDGFWIVRRRVRNHAGPDAIRFGAHNVVTGETCSGRAVL